MLLMNPCIGTQWKLNDAQLFLYTWNRFIMDNIDSVSLWWFLEFRGGNPSRTGLLIALNAGSESDSLEIMNFEPALPGQLTWFSGKIQTHPLKNSYRSLLRRAAYAGQMTFCHWAKTIIKRAEHVTAVAPLSFSTLTGHIFIYLTNHKFIFAEGKREQQKWYWCLPQMPYDVLLGKFWDQARFPRYQQSTMSNVLGILKGQLSPCGSQRIAPHKVVQFQCFAHLFPRKGAAAHANRKRSSDWCIPAMGGRDIRTLQWRTFLPFPHGYLSYLSNCADTCDWAANDSLSFAKSMTGLQMSYQPTQDMS